MIGKIIAKRNRFGRLEGFEFVELTEEKNKEILESVRKQNLEIFKMCYKDSEKFLKSKGIRDRKQILDLAICLFNKLGMQRLTRQLSELDKIVRKIKDNGVKNEVKNN